MRRSRLRVILNSKSGSKDFSSLSMKGIVSSTGENAGKNFDKSCSLAFGVFNHEGIGSTEGLAVKRKIRQNANKIHDFFFRSKLPIDETVNELSSISIIILESDSSFIMAHICCSLSILANSASYSAASRS